MLLCCSHLQLVTILKIYNDSNNIRYNQTQPPMTCNVIVCFWNDGSSSLNGFYSTQTRGYQNQQEGRYALVILHVDSMVGEWEQYGFVCFVTDMVSLEIFNEGSYATMVYIVVVKYSAVFVFDFTQPKLQLSTSTTVVVSYFVLNFVDQSYSKGWWPRQSAEGNTESIVVQRILWHHLR